MSYCRWSSDGWRSDVYAYEAGNGWITHVAGNRIKNIEDMPPITVGMGAITEWIEQDRAQKEWLEAHAVNVAIGLPHDGESFEDATAGGCADRLEALRGIGYHVPQTAIDALRREQVETLNAIWDRVTARG